MKTERKDLDVISEPPAKKAKTASPGSASGRILGSARPLGQRQRLGALAKAWGARGQHVASTFSSAHRRAEVQEIDPRERQRPARPWGLQVSGSWVQVELRDSRSFTSDSEFGDFRLMVEHETS